MAKKTEKGSPAYYEPPADPAAEQSVLGAILVRPEVMDEVVEVLKPGDFHREAHSKIFTAMLGLYNNQDPVDLVTVTQRLREAGWLDDCGGPVFLAELSEQVGFSTNAPFYAGIVKKKAALRRLLDISQKIATGCLGKVDDVDEFLSAAENEILKIREEDVGIETHRLETLVTPEIEKLERIHEGKSSLLGVPSGYIFLDQLTGGWQNSDLIILAARPSMGKTALGMEFAYHAAAKAGVPTVFFSLEQPKEQLVQRVLSARTQINASKLREAKLTGVEWSTLYAMQEGMQGIPLDIVDKSAMTPLEIRSQARRLKRRNNLGLIIVDYLQLCRLTKSRSREQEVGEVSRSMKALAKELNVPVIALAQLSRECERRPNKRPMLSDLRESGSIEQDADMVLFIYRDEVYRQDSPDAGLAEIKLAKHRNGPTGMFKLTYLAEYMSFKNYAMGGAE